MDAALGASNAKAALRAVNVDQKHYSVIMKQIRNPPKHERHAGISILTNSEKREMSILIGDRNDQANALSSEEFSDLIIEILEVSLCHYYFFLSAPLQSATRTHTWFNSSFQAREDYVLENGPDAGMPALSKPAREALEVHLFF